MKDEAIRKIDDSKENVEHNWAQFLIEPIAKFLQGSLEDGDEELAALIMLEHKTFQKCIDFVAKQCEKHLGGKRSGHIPDAEVYQMSVDYFTMDDAELERQQALEEAEKEKLRKKQIEANQRLREEREEKAKTEKADLAVQKKQSEGQISLF